MRPLFLSLGAGIVVVGAATAQTTGQGGSMPQLPVGQTFKQFEFPDYEDGKLKATLQAVEAKGITLNRAETTDLKIQVYDNGAVTTTITSPKADLYANEQKMRTKNTVLIERADMEATSQDCDFDLKTKKYLLRTNVRVLLKHFDLNMNPTNSPAMLAAPNSTAALPAAVRASPPRTSGSVLDSPGSYADTNSAPIPPVSSEAK